MGIEQSGRTDARTEAVEQPRGSDRPPAPTRHSRLESLHAARESQAARAAELERQRTAAPENGTEPADPVPGSANAMPRAPSPRPPRSIVSTWQTGGAHAWNAVNYNGEVLWVDA